MHASRSGHSTSLPGPTSTTTSNFNDTYAARSARTKAALQSDPSCTDALTKRVEHFSVVRSSSRSNSSTFASEEGGYIVRGADNNKRNGWQPFGGCWLCQAAGIAHVRRRLVCTLRSASCMHHWAGGLGRTNACPWKTGSFTVKRRRRRRRARGKRSEDGFPQRIGDAWQTEGVAGPMSLLA